MRLSEDLGEKTTLACCQPIIAECVRSENLLERQAGYAMLGLISETCKESFAKNLSEAMQMASAGVQDSNQRVRHAALGSLATLMEQLSPYVQIKYHAELMPVLGKLMVEEPTLKMQTQATRSVHAFCSGLLSFDEEDEEEAKVNGKDIMGQYASTTLNALVEILQKSIRENHEPLQAVTLGLIGTISDVIQEDFQQYFSTFIPIMVNLLTSTPADSMEAKKLRAKAITTIGSIITSISDSEDKEPFKANVLEITQHLATTIQGRLSDDDPQDEAIKDTLAQCAGFLGTDFTQFMPMLLDQLVADAQLDVDFKMESADMPSTTDNLEMKVKIKGLGEQKVSMNTDALIRKTGAFAVLKKVSENMGRAFAPFVEPLLPIVSAHMNYEHSKGIRKLALKTFRHMLVAVGEPQNTQLFQQSFPMYVEQLQKAISRHDDKTTRIVMKSLAQNLKALGHCNSDLGSILNDEQIAVLGPILKDTLDLVAALKAAHRQVIQKTKATYDIDEEDVEKIKEEMAEVGRVASQAMELSGQLVEKFGDRAFAVVDSSSKAYWATQLQGFAELTEEELLDALCFWCDFVDNTTAMQNDVATVTQLATKFLEVISHADFADSDLVKHTVAYGLGAFAHVLPKEAFEPLRARAVGIIKGITMRDEAFSEENMEATENAMGALAKIAYKHSGTAEVGEGDLAGVLGFFPFKSDECESQTTHRIFLEQIKDGSSIVHTAAVKPAAQEALNKLRAHVESESPDAEVKVLSHAGRTLLASITDF